MQQSVCKEEGKPWLPEKMLQPADVAAMIYQAISAPRHVEITDIFMRPSMPYSE